MIAFDDGVERGREFGVERLAFDDDGGVDAFGDRAVNFFMVHPVA